MSSVVRSHATVIDEAVRLLEQQLLPKTPSSEGFLLAASARYLRGESMLALRYLLKGLRSCDGLPAQDRARWHLFLSQIYLRLDEEDEAGESELDAMAGAEEALEAALGLDLTLRPAATGLMAILSSDRLMEACYALAQRVAATGTYWDDPWQRPSHYWRGVSLRSQAWWHADRMPTWCAALEAQFETIRSECLALCNPPNADDRLRLRDDAGWEEVGASHDAGDALLVSGDAASWQEMVLLGESDDGQDAREQVERNRRRCPVTTQLLLAIPEVAQLAEAGLGEALFSAIQPSTHLLPHCGGTNTRLTCHLGLSIPPGCRVRVADETSVWEEGRCLCFDDSFEHEVWHDGPAECGPRIVLLLRFWHPDIPPSRWEEVARDSAAAVLHDLSAQLPPLSMEPAASR